jgi:hypothetical protein
MTARHDTRPAPLRSAPSPRVRWKRAARWASLTAVALMASGCASVFLVDNQVQSFARWTDGGATAAVPPPTVPQPPQVYRFERLPSQSQSPRGNDQDTLEALTRDALAQHGWTPAAAGVAAPWLVQVTAATLRLPRAPWESPWPGYWGGHFGGGFAGPYVGLGGQVVWSPMFMHMESPYYQREVSLVIRQAATGRVAYETRAAHDGRWHTSPALWSAMLGAALQGFPSPAAGARQVNIEVPR